MPVYAVGCERGVHFYAMQFIDGQTLADLIQQLRQRPASRTAPARRKTDDRTTVADARAGRDPAATTEPAARQSTLATLRAPANSAGILPARGRLGVQAAEALDHAHQLGIVHRDVKPANLLLDGRGQLWVDRLRPGSLQHGEAGLTMTGDLVGTLRYMSPEQALAKRVPIDHRTDVYSLGATLYELLTLRPAFDGNGPAGAAAADRLRGAAAAAAAEQGDPARSWRSSSSRRWRRTRRSATARPRKWRTTCGGFATTSRSGATPSLLQRLRRWGRRHPAALPWRSRR